MNAPSSTSSTAPASAVIEPHLGRWGALTGIALTVVSFGAFTVEGGPDNSTATADQVRAFYTDKQTALQIYALVSMLVVALLLVFVSQLRSLIRQAQPREGILGDIAYGAGLLSAAGIWISASLAGFTFLVDDLSKVDPGVLRSWYSLGELDEYFNDLAALPQGLLVLAASLAALRYRILPRWLALLGIIIGTASVLSVFVPGPVSASLFTMGLFGFLLWPLLVGIVLTRRAFTRATHANA